MIDLHVHTTCSDGQLTVEEILDRARKQKIETISFCDHNVLGAYKLLENINLNRYDIKVIVGIEFDFVFQNKDFHMLGYNFNWKKMNESNLINKKTEAEIIEEEQEKLQFLKNVAKEHGIMIDENLSITKPNQKASTLLKYHMMEFQENDSILDEMLGKNRDKSFARGFVHNPNSPFFIDETIGLPTARKVADLIHSCDGKAVLAHPFDYKDINYKQYIQDIFDLGILDGIECIHTRHNLEQIQYIKEFCKKHNLLITGGSDFHRDGKQKLGFGVAGTFPIGLEYCLKHVDNL